MTPLELFREASAGLKASQRVCTTTSKILTLTLGLCHTLRHQERITPFITAYHDSQDHLLQTILQCALKVRESLQTDTSRSVARVEAQIAAVEAVVEVMRSTPVGGQKHLADFITMDHLDGLKEELAEVTQSFHVKLALVEGPLAVLKREVSPPLKDRGESSRGRAPQRNAPLEPDTLDIAAITKDAESLALDMTSILASVTSHYDQCLRLKHMEPAHADALSLLELVSADARQLEPARQTLETIQLEAIEIYEYLQLTRTPPISAKALRETLSQMGAALSVETAPFTASLESLEQFCTSLTDHYNQFIHSYYNMMMEVRRREKVRALFLQEVDRSLQTAFRAFEKEEMVVRKQFWADNGEFIPKDLVSPAFLQWSAKLPPLSLHMEDESLPEIPLLTLTALEKYITSINE